jgi:hypothetical protein
MTVKKDNVETSAAAYDTALLVRDMPIAKALISNDTTSLANIIGSALPKSGVKVEDVCIQKTVGEAFTGGRSTPIYCISCLVIRANNTRFRRHFCAKLITMPGETSAPDCGEQKSKSIPGKLWVKRESYAVECRTSLLRLCSSPCQLLSIDGRRGQTGHWSFQDYWPVISDRDGLKPWPAVCFLMNDLRFAGFPVHPEFLSIRQTKAALKWIATFHCLFWAESDQDNSSSTWKRDLWSRGGHWTVKSPTG